MAASRSQPVTGKFLQEGERGKIAHAIEVNFAVEMIEFVLDDTGMKIFGDEVELVTIAIESLHADSSCSAVLGRAGRECSGNLPNHLPCLRTAA